MPAVDLRFPFTGRWLTQNSPANRVPSHGTTRFASSHAIDFVPVDGAGRTAPVTLATFVRPEPLELFAGFGRTVLSPIDGLILAVQDGEPDHHAYRGLPSVGYALTQNRRARTAQGLAGNHVLIRSDDVVIALCHLQRGSLLVDAGQRVRIGAPLGLCGNSGNSTEPHLHIQAMDSADMDTARAVPLTFEGRLPRNGEIVDAGGSNGTLLPLEDLIDEYAPTLSAILEERPDIRAAITASDGHIYSLPSVEELGLVQYPNFLFINTTWLGALGLPMPTTIDEYHEALVAFATQDPNGNGVADEIPLSFRTDAFAANPHDLIAALGGQPENNDHRIVRDDTVEFTANSDEYKAAVSALGDWYAEGLIDPESFSQDDVAYLSKGKSSTPILGSFFWWELKEMVGEDRVDDYALVGILEGVDGEKLASVANNQEIGRGAMAITRSNEYPAATMRWADRLFDPVMSAQSNWGPIGVTLEEDANGVLVQIPAQAGESEGERRQRVAPGGPKITTAEDFETVVAPEPRAAERQQLVQEFYAPHQANDPYPPVMLSNDELDRVSFANTDINTLVKEKFAAWIVDGTVEDEWDAYVSQLQTLGVDDVIATYQEAYDRFQEGGE